MPKRFASKQQAKAFFAAARGHSTLGISKSVAQKAVAENAGRSLKRLPRKVKRFTKKG